MSQLIISNTNIEDDFECNQCDSFKRGIPKHWRLFMNSIIPLDRVQDLVSEKIIVDNFI